MFILISVLILSLSSLALLILRLARPKFKYLWLVAAAGAVLSLVSVFVWQMHMPQTLSLPPWHAFFQYSLIWRVSDYSWPYALGLAVLALASIFTSVMRQHISPMTWVGTLLLTGLGILAVTAENLLTLVLAWAALDLVELIIMLASAGHEKSENVIIAFAARAIGIGLAIWASVTSGMTPFFRNLAPNAGLYLLLASGLRLSVLPLHLPYSDDPRLRRDFGTILRLVAAASSLALLPRIPSEALQGSLLPYLMALTAIAALFSGYFWLRASDELTGRPFLVLGMASLAITATLNANPVGSIAWGIALIFSGGFLSLYSARYRALLWIPILSAWGLSALPFSPSASGWMSGLNISWLYMIPYLFAHALLLAGYFRHAMHPGESSIESHPRWAQIIYIIGLMVIPIVLLLLGFWGWGGAHMIGIWWAALGTLMVAIVLTWLTTRFLAQTTHFAGNVNRWSDLLRFNSIYRGLWNLLNGLNRIAGAVTNTLEGDGGVLWSILLLVLLVSLAVVFNK